MDNLWENWGMTVDVTVGSLSLLCERYQICTEHRVQMFSWQWLWWWTKHPPKNLFVDLAEHGNFKSQLPWLSFCQLRWLTWQPIEILDFVDSFLSLSEFHIYTISWVEIKKKKNCDRVIVIVNCEISDHHLTRCLGSPAEGYYQRSYSMCPSKWNG